MRPSLPEPTSYFVDRLRELHVAMRDRILDEMRSSAVEELSAIADSRDGDTIYGIDEKGEQVLFDYCDQWGQEMPFVLIAEGIPGSGARVFPAGADESRAAFRMIIDPIDGTRELMYNKRSAWILSGVAPNLGPDSTLADIEVAMQTEIPTTRQHLSDLLYAVRGDGARGETHNLLDGSTAIFVPKPSRAKTIAHGFATISKFFPGAKSVLVEIEERMVEAAVGRPRDGNPLAFDDEYISSGGQLYELIMGHDRVIADLRPFAYAVTPSIGPGARLCAHPYDLCSELIAREAGIIVTDEHGEPLSAKLDIREDLCWVGYANEHLREQIQPVLLDVMADIKDRAELTMRVADRFRPGAPDPP